MYSLIQVGSFVQPYVNSLSSIMSWLPILSQPLADGADVYPGEGWCKVHFTVYIKVLYEDLILWMRSNKRKCRPHSNEHSYDVTDYWRKLKWQYFLRFYSWHTTKTTFSVDWRASRVSILINQPWFTHIYPMSNWSNVGPFSILNIQIFVDF